MPTEPTVPKISDVTAETCWVEWGEPSTNGGQPIKGSDLNTDYLNNIDKITIIYLIILYIFNYLGYIIERKKSKSERWIKLNVEPIPTLYYEARRMIEGTEYQIRARAVNDCGVGAPSSPSAPFTPLGMHLKH